MTTIQEIENFVEGLIATLSNNPDEKASLSDRQIELIKIYRDAYTSVIQAGEAQGDEFEECDNCGTKLPEGCSGLFKSDGDSCLLNRQ